MYPPKKQRWKMEVGRKRRGGSAHSCHRRTFAGSWTGPSGIKRRRTGTFLYSIAEAGVPIENSMTQALLWGTKVPDPTCVSWACPTRGLTQLPRNKTPQRNNFKPSLAMWC
eukprot:4587773-Amphidinium_carterae.1